MKGQTVTAVVSAADPAKVVWSQPVAVLIGNGTAGPAEILASAIADNKRGDDGGRSDLRHRIAAEIDRNG